jgi:ornithine cyclodeaminase/alanine dehydrogenase-like protein (mu-crystallin family)
VSEFLLLTEEHVRSVLPIRDLIPCMEAALGRFSAGEVQQPVRTVLRVGAERHWWGLMPAYVNQPATMGAKLVTVFNTNAARGLDTHQAFIVLLDPDTGALQALMDGRYVTEARTAAVSAVSARYLSRADASTLAIIGTGVQARGHLHGLTEVRALRDVRVWSPRPASRERFVADVQPGAGAPVRAVGTAEDAVRGADLVVLATSSSEPVVDVSWIAPGSHIVSVGAPTPRQREMAPALTARARVFVDSRAAAVVESGDIVMGIAEGWFRPDHIAGELGDVVLGRMPGRTSADDITVFKALGMAIEDVAAADLAFRRAVERGVGSRQVL